MFIVNAGIAVLLADAPFIIAFERLIARAVNKCFCLHMTQFIKDLFPIFPSPSESIRS